MAGTTRGKIECLFWPQVHPSYTWRDCAQGIFTSLYNFCLSHPNMTLIARNGGSGGGASNINYWDQANPFNNNAWYVFRMNTITENPLYTGTRTYPWYMLVQFHRADLALFGASPGNPGLCDGLSSFGGTECRVAVQFAVGVGGTQNPWNGSGTLGANTKGTPVWTTPSGGTGVMVWPRSNNTGGTHNTNRENCAIAFYKDTGTSTTPYRVHFMADDDSIAMFGSAADDNNYHLTYFGLFSKRPNFSVDYPLVFVSTLAAAIPINRTLVYGSTSGQGFGATSPNNGGGIAGPGNSVRGLLFERYSQFFDPTWAIMNPSKYYATATFDEYPISLMMYEYPNFFGWAGQIDFIREVASIETHTRNTDSSRIVLGGSAAIVNNVKVSAPWGSGVQPRSGMFREGINF